MFAVTITSFELDSLLQRFTYYCTFADKLDENFKKSMANVANVDALPTIGLNVLDILKHEKLVLTADAVKAVEARLA